MTANNLLIEKLRTVEARYEELNQQLADPDLASGMSAVVDVCNGRLWFACKDARRCRGNNNIRTISAIYQDRGPSAPAAFPRWEKSVCLRFQQIMYRALPVPDDSTPGYRGAPVPSPPETKRNQHRSYMRNRKWNIPG